MGDKSPKNKTKQTTQKTVATDRAKGDKKKRQEGFNHTPVKSK